MRTTPLAILLLGLSSCRSCASEGGARDGSAPAASDAASPARAADAGAHEGGSRPTVANLLYTTASVVAVSSKVDNPRDFPEHLIDGKAETAWSRTAGLRSPGTT